MGFGSKRQNPTFGFGIFVQSWLVTQLPKGALPFFMSFFEAPVDSYGCNSHPTNFGHTSHELGFRFLLWLVTKAPRSVHSKNTHPIDAAFSKLSTLNPGLMPFVPMEDCLGFRVRLERPDGLHVWPLNKLMRKWGGIRKMGGFPFVCA